MQFFEQSGGTLLYRNNGETVALTPWGADSLRVCAVFLGDISDESAALLPPADSTKSAVICIDGTRVHAACGWRLPSQSDVCVESQRAHLRHGAVPAGAVGLEGLQSGAGAPKLAVQHEVRRRTRTGRRS